ncbi:hypothetical protein LUZ61_011009 [Rhynchospora tenuis]|uniref:Neprosin PEP catalytic domain-containing protein n=1 Tax=Rhynchospora tenuis TaxID=198213 RepID=A0AAD6EZW7_9POAL|nr:hypothetical protein LUZ61_011009 [Rhynchospora tenuis]
MCRRKASLVACFARERLCVRKGRDFARSERRGEAASTFLFVSRIGNNGCYSNTCQGFVLSNVSGAPLPGAIPQPLSTYNGEDHFVTLSIKKDEETLDWSLYQDDNNNPILIGWWPKTLFNNTFDSATKIAWLGSVFYPKNETSPPMGSGHFAVEGAHKAAYISHIKIFDEFGQATDPYIGRGLTDRKDCFTTDGFKYSHHDGFHFYYGGPSGCQN